MSKYIYKHNITKKKIFTVIRFLVTTILKDEFFRKLVSIKNSRFSHFF